MRRFLAARPSTERRLVVSFSILSLGTGLSLSVLAVYLVRQLHAGTAAYGLAMSVAALCGMVSGPVAGRLADRADTRRTYAVLVWTMAVATGLLAVADEWVAFVLVSILMMCGRGGAAVLGALVGWEVPAERRVGYRAVVKTASNAAMLTGLGLGAVVLSIDSRPLFRASFLVEAATLLAAGALIGTSRGSGTAAPPKPMIATVPETRPARAVYRDRRFLALTSVNAVVLLYSSLLTVGLPLWLAAQAPTLLWLVAAVTAVNVVAVLLLQIPVSNAVKDIPAAVRAGTRGTVLVGAAIAMFALADVVHGTVAKASVLILLGLVVAGGEVLYAASSWELVYALAPEESLGEYQGVYNMGLDVSMLMAPILFAWLAGGHHTPWWLALAAVFLICAALLPAIVGQVVGQAEDQSDGICSGTRPA